MDSGLVVGHDQGLYRRLQTACDSELRFRHVTSLAAAATDSSLGGTPLVTVLDLRRDEAFTELPRLAQLRSEGQMTGPVYGVVHGGIPLDAVVSADQLLSAYWQFDDLHAALGQALESLRAHRPPRMAPPPECRVLERDGVRFMTCTTELFRVLEDVEVAACHDLTILLIGETGTGKTTLAKLVHAISPRRMGPFVEMPCGAMPRELIGSELFGHVKGAFTSAHENKVGRFVKANSGSILLDEIDILDLMQQANLLRVIETGKFEPVGSVETQSSDVRTIVASNAQLEPLIKAGSFRADLYYRLKQMQFELPPLRSRPFDLVPLAIEEVKASCRQHGVKVTHVDPSFLRVIKAHPWPGNARELSFAVKRAAIYCRDGVLCASNLPADIVSSAAHANHAAHGCELARNGLAGEVAAQEKNSIERMLQVNNFNRTATARALGISRVTLYNKIRKHRIEMSPSR